MPWTTLRRAVMFALVFPATIAAMSLVLRLRGDDPDLVPAVGPSAVGAAVGCGVLVLLAWRGTRHDR